MKVYLLKRLLQIIPTLLGITLITFLIIQLAPGNPAALKIHAAAQGQIGDKAISQQIVEDTKKLYGLDKPRPRSICSLGQEAFSPWISDRLSRTTGRCGTK